MKLIHETNFGGMIFATAGHVAHHGEGIRDLNFTPENSRARKGG